MKRTLQNCRLVKIYGANQYDRKCEGIAKSKRDDEPCEICKKCKLHYINVEEADNA